MRQALVNHLKPKDIKAPVKVVKPYAGEVADKKRSSRINGKLPAILVFFIEGRPVAEVPSARFSLLFITETNVLDSEKAEADALNIVEHYAEYLLNEPLFEDDDHYYCIDENEPMHAETLLSDIKYTIIDLQLIIKKIK